MFVTTNHQRRYFALASPPGDESPYNPSVSHQTLFAETLFLQWGETGMAFSTKVLLEWRLTCALGIRESFTAHVILHAFEDVEGRFGGAKGGD